MDRFLSGIVRFGILSLLGVIALLLLLAAWVLADPAGVLRGIARIVAALCAVCAVWLGFTAAGAAMLSSKK
ncbi:MAG: hypothetical protein II727_03015 [Oscillospiraceae bacterium]|nr:hypothetical protein [Oscillospiraceae bacterium]